MQLNKCNEIPKLVINKNFRKTTPIFYGCSFFEIQNWYTKY